MSAYDTEQLDRMEPGYLANYGLREAPFSPTHQDKFLYLDAERAQRLNLLQHMTQYSNLLLIVQGERGVGKTSLLTRFVSNAENEWHVCEVTANTMMDAEQLMFQAAQGFGLEQLPQDASQLQEMLYARVATMHHNNEVPILIIDDAHELPKDALLAIFNLADTYVDEEHLLRIVLFCEPEVEKILKAKDIKVLRERITHTMEIPPLDEDTTAEYLKHRLAVAGFAGGSPFTPKIIKRLYKASHGLPGELNILAHEILEHGDFEKDESRDIVKIHGRNKQPKPVLFISAAVIFFAVLLVFQDNFNSLFEDQGAKRPSTEMSGTEMPGTKTSNTETPAIELADTSGHASTGVQPEVPLTPTIESKANEPDIKRKIIPLNLEVRIKKDEPVADQQQKTSAPTVKEKEETGAEPLTTAQETAQAGIAQTEKKIDDNKPALQSIQLYGIDPDPVTGSAKPQTLTINGQGFTPQTEVTVGWTGKEVKLSPYKVKVENENLIKISITVGRNADNWSLRVTDPVKGKSNALGFQVTAIEDNLTKGERWTLAQNPESFTLQLFGTNEKKNADQFIEKHNIKAQSAYFQIQRKGKAWYSVVYGEFPDQTKARQAIKTLPGSLKKLNPWVRRFDDIHASINTSRKVIASRQKKRSKKPARIPLATSPLPKNATAEQHASWLWSQDPRSFTLQLLGARQSNSVNKFLRKYTTLNGKAVYFHTRHNARDWYTVVYGVYLDRASAKKAIERLPRELKSSSPWIRSFASIHAELDRAE